MNTIASDTGFRAQAPNTGPVDVILPQVKTRGSLALSGNRSDKVTDASFTVSHPCPSGALHTKSRRWRATEPSSQGCTRVRAAAVFPAVCSRPHVSDPKHLRGQVSSRKQPGKGSSRTSVQLKPSTVMCECQHWGHRTWGVNIPYYPSNRADSLTCGLRPTAPAQERAAHPSCHRDKSCAWRALL